MLKSTNTIEAFGSHYVADKYDHIFTDEDDGNSGTIDHLVPKSTDRHSGTL
jgi:hypothetical protein